VWTWFLGKDGSAEDYLDLMYVVLFIGTRALLELLKLPRLKYMPSMDNSNNEELKNETPEEKEIREELNYRIDRGAMRFDRASASYGTIFKVILTPVWIAFLILFIAKYGGDVLNIVYFALTPFDELFDGILSNFFLNNTQSPHIPIPSQRNYDQHPQKAIQIPISGELNFPPGSDDEFRNDHGPSDNGHANGQKVILRSAAVPGVWWQHCEIFYW
jgi:hypothetical protein